MAEIKRKRRPRAKGVALEHLNVWISPEAREALDRFSEAGFLIKDVVDACLRSCLTTDTSGLPTNVVAYAAANMLQEAIKRGVVVGMDHPQVDVRVEKAFVSKSPAPVITTICTVHNKGLPLGAT